jgi:predicted PurR-regulated permease PerM
MSNSTHRDPVTTLQVQSFLVGSASLVVVVAGLRAAQQVMIPVIFALLLAAVASPAVRALRKTGLPKALAIIVVMVLVTLSLVAFGAVLADSVGRFTTSIPQYQTAFDKLLADGQKLLVSWGVPPSALETGVPGVTTGVVLNTLGQGIAAVANLLSNLLVVVITTGFLLLEASDLERKVTAAFGADSAAASGLSDAATKVQRYLGLKTLVSLLTGVLAGIVCVLVGLPFPVLWGLVAFLLNYVPAIGSIVAAGPPVALAAVALEPGGAVFVAVGYLVINVFIGNILDPRLMGRRLGLSPLVVLLSLFFWGFVWGPAGMLLSVPMMVVLKLVLESIDSTRWIAVMMSSGKEAEDITG